ncbi:MAG: DUF6443 domain-containing protein, partial [Aureispira sp.]
MKITQLLAVLLLVAQCALAQHPYDNALNPIKDVLPPSPTASGLAIYGEIPVSMHTGIPNVSIPLSGIKGRTLSLPMSLSYHSGGHQVDAISSWVGLGWSLNAGGVVTRTANGIEDDGGSQGGLGYWNQAVKVDLYNASHSSPATLQEALAAESYYNYLKNVANRRADGQPDQFNFNFAGYTGRFFVENNNGTLIPRLVPHQDIKIDLQLNAGKLSVLVFTTPEGTVYTFGGVGTNGVKAVETSQSNTVGTQCGHSYSLPVITSWYLTSVRSANGTDEINLNYQDNPHGISYSTGIREQASKKGYAAGCTCCNNVSPASSLNGGRWEHQPCEQVIDLRGVYLSSITSKGQQVVFQSTSQREDLPNARRLTNILYYGKAGTLLKSVALTHDYYQPAAGTTTSIPSLDKRLRLLTVTEKDANGQSNPSYQLEYHPLKLPARLSYGKDFWGFYNGQNNNTSLIPSALPNNPAFYSYGGNRSPNSNFAKAGILTKITYPTGGHSMLDYEANAMAYDTPLEETRARTAYALAEYDYPTSGMQTVYGGFTINYSQEVNIIAKVHKRCGGHPRFSSYLKIEKKVGTNWQPLTTTNSNINASGNQNDGKGTIRLGGISNSTAITSLYQHSFKLDLPAGEYRLVAVAVQGCINPTINDKVEVAVQYLEKTGNLIYNQEVGGLRVKQTTLHDGLDTNKDIITQYDYQKSNVPSVSSGYAARPVDYYQRNTTYFPVFGDIINGCRLNPSFSATQQDFPNCICEQPVERLFSDSQVPLNGVSGGHIAYAEVTQVHGINAVNGKTWNRFSQGINSSANGGGNLVVPASLLDWRGGRLEEQIVYKKEGNAFVKVRATQNDYQTSSTTGNGLGVFHGIAVNLKGHQRDWINPDRVHIRCTYDNTGNNGVNTLSDGTVWYHPCHNYNSGDYVIDWPVFGRFNYVYYPIYYGWEKLERSTVKQYNENGVDYVETITEYDYDDLYTHLTSTKVTNSDGTIYTTENKYPTDYTIQKHRTITDARVFAIQKLQEQHQHAIPIESTKYLQKVGESKKLIGSMFTAFEIDTNNPKAVNPISIHRSELAVPLAIHNASYRSTAVDGNNNFYNMGFYSQYGAYTGHNDKGLPLGFQRKSDLNNSFVWGYDDRAPILKATNAHHTELGYTSFEGGDEANWSINTAPYTTGKIGKNALQTIQEFPVGQVFTIDGQEKKYKFSAWVKTSGNNSANLVLRTCSRSAHANYPNVPSAYAQTSFSNTNGAWQLVEVELDVAQIRADASLAANDLLDVHAYFWNPTQQSIDIDAVRFHPSDAFVETYDYEEETLLPIAMEGVNRLHSSYHYDDFQRLSYVKDFEGNIVMANDYYYKNGGAIENHVTTKAVRVAGKTSLASLTGLPLTELTESYQYLDGLGRAIQSVSKGQSPTGTDIVAFQEYDELGRQPKAYLPFVHTSQNSGSFTNNPILLAQNFYSNEIAPESQSAYAFGETVFEAAPLHRPKEQSSPGAGWELGSSHTLRTTYAHNKGSDVLRLDAQTTSPSYYPANSLFKTTVINTKGVKSISYTDKIGRTILVQQQVSPTVWTSTYTLYNEFGNVQAIITPLAVETMQQLGNYNYTQTALEELIYTYSYDQRQRLKSKKIPNSAVLYYVYDKLDRPVATQDGNQRLLGQWMLQKYDQYNRPIVSALYHSNLGQLGLQLYFDQQSSVFETRASNAIGYTNTIPVLAANDPIQNITYYDDYDFDNDGQADVNTAFVGNVAYPTNYFERTFGQATGSKVRLLDASNRFLQQVTYYDERGRVIQTQGENHLNGKDISWSSYDFVGNLTKMKYQHTTTQNHVTTEVVTEEFFQYDHTGRLLKVYHKVGNEDKILLAQHNYDELGRLIEKNLHSTNEGANFLQSIDYHYNVKDWLVRINDLYQVTPASIDPAPSSVALLEKRINEIVLKYNGQEVGSGEVETEIKIDDETVDLVNGIVVASQQNQAEIDLYGAGYTTTKDEEVKVDFSDKTITKDNIGASLEELEARLQQKLTENGVTDPVIMEVLLKDLKAEYRDRWLLLRSNTENEDNEDLFSMNFDYDYGGNIHHLEWKVASYDYRSIYDYNYDHLDRLSNANYKEYLESSTPMLPLYQRQHDFSVNNIAYDVMGNITHLERRGTVAVLGTSLTNGLMDDLSYTYKGNQLQAVQDAGHATTGFVDGASTNQEYTYDANGNVTRDDNKQIVVAYNHLNLPQQINFTPANAQIDWLYTASGQKVQKKVTDANNNITYKHYIGNVQYVNATIDFIQHQEGR